LGHQKRKVEVFFTSRAGTPSIPPRTTTKQQQQQQKKKKKKKKKIYIEREREGFLFE